VERNRKKDMFSRRLRSTGIQSEAWTCLSECGSQLIERYLEMQALKVGWIGTGVMGKSMAGHLIKNGYSLQVFTRTASKAEDLLKQGATWVNPKDLASSSDVIFLMLGYPHDVEKVVLDTEHGILKDMKEGSILVDHTTSTPGLAERIYQEAIVKGVHSIDAPVSGGDIGARNGKLVTMAGGDEAALGRVKALLECYSQELKHMGGAGKGQHTKAANQILIAGAMISTCESLIYGHKAGLDLSQLINVLNKGAASSFTLERLAPRMLKRDFDPGFYVEHFVKDLGIALEESKRMNISLPGTALVQQFYMAMIAQGGGRNGTQGLLEVLERFNNVQVKKYDI